MADRELRDGTRKNYKKLAEGESDAEDSEKEVAEPPKNPESGNESDSSAVVKKTDDDESEEDEIDEDAVRKAEENLRKVQDRAEQEERKEKIRRLSKEAKKIEESLKSRKKTKGKSDLTIASLRDMKEIAGEVDKIMDNQLKVKKVAKKKRGGASNYSSDSDSSSSSSDDTSTSSSSSSESKSSNDEKEKRRKHRSKKRGKKKEKSGKRKSGKSKRLTSSVKFPQKWPHSHLSLHFVNRNKKYEELTIAEFCAGFSTIIENCSEQKRMHRLAHLRELMYLATRYQWRCVLNYHAACLLEIERGHLRWGDSFQVLQNTTLAGGFLNNSRGGPNNSGGTANNSSPSGSRTVASGSGNDEGQVIFCRSYQRGFCSQPRDHYGQFRGENRLLKHICAKCWLVGRKVELHPENSDDCPLKDQA